MINVMALGALVFDGGMAYIWWRVARQCQYIYPLSLVYSVENEACSMLVLTQIRC